MVDTTTRIPMVLNTTMTEKDSRSTRLQTVVLRPRASKSGQVGYHLSHRGVRSGIDLSLDSVISSSMAYH